MRKPTLLLIFLMMTGTASASLFTDLQGIFGSHKSLQANEKPVMQINNYDSLMQSLYKLNQPNLISVLDSEMTRNNIKSVKVHIQDYQKDFYVLKGIGVVENYPNQPDRSVTLTSRQIKRTIPIISDGRIDILEWIQLQAIYRLG